jgi:very-short-patch-repair endonuclease
MDFYCADAKLAIELDRFQHGQPDVARRDKARDKDLAEQGIENLRFWNHQWRKNSDGCLTEIWNALQRRTGCIRVMKNSEEQRFVPPEPQQVKTQFAR